MATPAQKEIRRLHAVVRERDQLLEAAAASQAAAARYRGALRTLVEACGHVNIGALNGTTVKDFRKVMAFMAACDAAKELVGED